MEFRETVLANGLEVIAECNSEAHTSAVGFFVRTGARDEWDAVSGVSHFLEHMVFKGTPTRSAEDVNREFDELGAHYNAFTSEESTVYYAAVLPEYLTAAVELWADVLRPSLRDEDFETEKKVIVEEIRMYEDQPPFGADDKCRSLFFNGHPLGRSVLGTVKSISDLSVEQMRGYFQQRYSPRNITVVASGRLDFDTLVRAVESRCGEWVPFDAPREVVAPLGQAGGERMHKPTATMTYAMQLARGPAATDPDRFAAKILATVLGDDSGSRMYWDLIDPGLAEHASLGHHDYQGAGTFITFLACGPESAEANLQRIADVYRSAEELGIREDELQQTKSKINSRVVLASERPRGRLFTVGANWIMRREYRTVHDDLEAIDRLTVSEVADVLRKYPLSRNMTVVVGP